MSKAERRKAAAQKAHKTPPKAQPWDIRPKPERGSANSDDVYRAVGMALTSWEYVENAVADIFVSVVGDPFESANKSPATRAYGAVTNFNSRADMVEAAAYAFLNPERTKAKADAQLLAHRTELREQFKTLLGKFRSFAGRRNDIAHGIVDSNRLGSFLYPASYNAKKHPLEKADLTLHQRALFCYAAEDIHYYRERFEDLYDELSAFCREVWRDHHASGRPKPSSET
jgi:hypothetical protein